MKHKLTVIIALLLSTQVWAQSISHKVMNAGGNSFSCSTFSCIYSIGETFTTSLSAGNVIMTQGFQQPVFKYFKDNDQDTYGNRDSVVYDFVTPVGYVLDSTDCDDNNATLHNITIVSAIQGASTVLANSTITLTDSTANGTWSSTNTTIATIDANGVVTGVTAGKDTIKYTVTNLCGTTVKTKIITVTSACLPSYVSTNGLIGWWPFCGNANDESGNGNNGTVTNATLTTDRFSNNNTAYYFNGNANIVSTISTLPVGNNSRTMSAWVKWDSVQAVWDNSIACYGSCPAYSNGGSWGLRIWDTSGAGNAGNAIVNLYGCGTGDAKSHFHPNKNWHNIIGIYNGSVQKLYVDGVFVKSLNYTLNTILSQFVIGASENLTITHGNFKGTIDDIGIWNRVLTQQEITALYLSGCSPTSSSQSTSICSSALPYTWQGKTFTATHLTDTLKRTNYNGCDSIVNLSVIVNPVSTSTIDSTICSSQLPLFWNGITCSTAGTFYDTLAGGNYVGCDSIIAMHLHVKQSSTSTTYLTVCSNQMPYSWNGSSIPFAGSWAVPNLVNAAGCDSTANLVLTVANSTQSTASQTICSSQLPYSHLGHTMNAAGKDTLHLTNAKGCDSLAILNLTVNTALSSSVTLAPPTGNSCFAGATTFTATATNGGANPIYEWFLNGASVGFHPSPYTRALYLNNSIVKVKVYPQGVCAAPSMSNNDTVQVIKPQATVTRNGGALICAGNPITFRAVASGCSTNPSLTYQWTINRNPVGGNVDTFISATLQTHDTVRCKLVDAACPALPSQSNVYPMTIKSPVIPSVSLAALSANSVCFASPVTFTVTATNAGTNPIYQWFLNGVNDGFHPSPYTRPIYTNNTIVKVKVYPQVACPATSLSNSDTVQMIKPLATVTRNGGAVICPGAPITFRATASGCSKNPTLSYQWTINRNPVGGNVDTFISTTLQTHDTVRCKLVDAACPALPSFSNQYPMTIASAALTATVSLAAPSANNVCFASPVTFTATSSNSGANPAYQWFLNGANDGFHTSPYTRKIYTNNSIVNVKVYPHVTCANTAMSNSDTIQIHTCTIVRLQAPNSNEDKEAIAGIELYPNPAMDNVTIRYQLPENNVDAAQISILDITGKQVQAQTIEHPETIGIAKFDLSNLQAGVYLVNVKTTGFTQTQKLVVSK